MKSPVAPSQPSAGVGWVPALLTLATVAVYLNGLNAPFVFDDIPSIVENATLQHLWPLSGPWSPPGEGLTVSGRPMLNFSLALNAAAHAGPWGFRATNLAIHLAAGLLLCGILRRTLTGPKLGRDFGSAAPALAALIASLWLLHPLQTAAVTYIIQRAESLMGFFYLLTVYAFIRGAHSPRPSPWFMAAGTACLLGMATKEVMVSAPLIVLLYDRLVLCANWKEVWARRKVVHLALAGTWLPLAWWVLGTGARGGVSGFSLGVGWLAYAATQFHAITSYLVLSVWPDPLALDYGVRWADGVGDVAPYALAVVALITGTLFALYRGRTLAFLGLWFFAVLAPTSLMPGGRQTMADHRMYLPLAAVIVWLVLGSYRRLGRPVLAGWCAIAVVLGALTTRRNTDYRSTLAIWGDTVAKRPDNRWARDNFGNALLEAGRPADALIHYEAALRLAPNDAVHHYNAGNALLRLERTGEAIAHFSSAVRLDEHYLPARVGLGHALERARRFEEAVAVYRHVIQVEPVRAINHGYLANALFFAGRADEAIAEFKVACQFDPANAEFAYGLGCLLLQTGRSAEAVTEFERTVRLAPQYGEAHNNLGSALSQLGRFAEALRHVREAVRLDPNNPEARRNLELLERTVR